MLNSWNASSPNVTKYRKEILSSIWDDVYSFDKSDCVEHGWKYIGLHYFSKQNLPKVQEADAYDLYFVGGIKGNREGVIIDIYDKCRKNKTKCLMDVYVKKDYSGGRIKQREDDETFRVRTSWIPYNTVLEGIASSNCILEILQENQTSQSVRYFEAIAYNKKLLTNNQDIVDMPYYNEKYMRYFERIDEIDMEWIREKEIVDYGYTGDFSPVEYFCSVLQQV